MPAHVSARWNRLTPVRVVGAVVALSIPAFVVAAAPVGAAPTPSTASRAEPPLPAPPQMRDLDALLGRWKCLQTDPPPPAGQEGTVMYVDTKRALNGHYLYSDVVLNPGNLHGRQVFGWNPVDGVFTRFEYDDWGTSDTTTSPPLKDGHLVFTGDVTAVSAPSATGHAPGGHYKIKDDYDLARPGYRTVATTVTTAEGASYSYSGPCNRLR
jgi:hypothetical protein